MSDLRTAAQQALEALENTSPLGHNMESDKKFFAAITALRAALAEPVQEPFALPCPTPKACKAHCCSGQCIPRTAPPRSPAEPVQEPVAWLYTGIKSDGSEHGPHLVWRPEYMDAMSASKGAKATPLYTVPFNCA